MSVAAPLCFFHFISRWGIRRRSVISVGIDHPFARLLALSEVDVTEGPFQPIHVSPKRANLLQCAPVHHDKPSKLPMGCSEVTAGHFQGMRPANTPS